VPAARRIPGVPMNVRPARPRPDVDRAIGAGWGGGVRRSARPGCAPAVEGGREAPRGRPFANPCPAGAREVDHAAATVNLTTGVIHIWSDFGCVGTITTSR